jgi:hypothetical protein
MKQFVIAHTGIDAFCLGITVGVIIITIAFVVYLSILYFRFSIPRFIQ